MTRLTDRAVKVKCDFPEGADEIDIALFIADALSTWGGQRHPDDPLFGSLDVRSVTIAGTEYLIDNHEDGISAKGRARPLK